jgi:DNA modification methylase
MEKLQIEYIPTSEIVEYQNNPKKHPQNQIDKLKKSIKENGFVNPILLNKENVIIAGHGRLKASKELNLSAVPVIWLEHLSEAQQKAFRIADNKLTESEWDDELLKIEFEGLEELEFDTDLTGFDNKEVSQIYDQFNETEEDDFDTEKSLKEPKYKVKRGDLFQLGDHFLLCGDATSKEDVDKLMNGNKADITFTSPPYNVGHNLGYKNKDSKYRNNPDNNKEYFNFLCNATDNALNNSRYVFLNIQFLENNKQDIIKYMNKFVDKFCDIAFWKKSQVQPAMANNVMNSQTEVILIFSNETNHRAIKTANFRGNVSNIIETKSATGENKYSDIINAVYPLEFVSHFIKNFSQKSVLDPFAGSGSTLIACEQTNRNCYMMELDTTYCSVIIERWEKYTNKKAQKIN